MERYDNLMSQEDAAAYLGIQRRTLWRWRRKRIGPAWIQFGAVKSKPLYRRADLDAFILARRIEASRMPRPLVGRWPGKRANSLGPARPDGIRK